MRWVPVDTFEMLADLPPEEVMRRIARVTGRQALFRRADGDFLFTGETGERSFRIARRLAYRNSFRPVIHGEIRASGSGSVIAVRQELAPPVKVFVLAWFGALGLFLAACLLVALAGQGAVGLFVCCAMGAAACCVVNGGFWLEANKTQRLLHGLLR